MKTIDDVIAAYPEWPSDYKHARWIGMGCNSLGEIRPYQENSAISERVHGCYPICTREQYEQRKAELAKESDNDWYDYENQKAISLPPVGAECEVFNHNLGKSADWEKAKILFIGVFKCVYTSESCNERVGDVDTIDAVEFRPIDWNKNQVKIVSLESFINSGIDMEFASVGKWEVSSLHDIDGTNYGYEDNRLGWWKQCRPRQNHPMVLTDEQVKLIPEGFYYESYPAGMDLFIVTFKCLKPGYKYEWEK